MLPERATRRCGDCDYMAPAGAAWCPSCGAPPGYESPRKARRRWYAAACRLAFRHVREHGLEAIALRGVIRAELWRLAAVKGRHDDEQTGGPTMDELERDVISIDAYVRKRTIEGDEGGVWLEKQRGRGRRSGQARQAKAEERRRTVTWPLFDAGMTTQEALEHCHAQGVKVSRRTMYRDADAYRIDWCARLDADPERSRFLR